MKLIFQDFDEHEELHSSVEKEPEDKTPLDF